VSVLALAAALAAAFQSADTVVDARRGDRLVIEQVTGRITVTAWDRDAVELRTERGTAGVVVRRSGTDLHVEHADGARRRSIVATLRVPAWIDLEAGSNDLDIAVSGVDGAIRVRNLGGDVRIEDVGGPVEARSLRGEIVVADARGPVRVSSQSDDVTLRRISGPVEAHSGDGDLVLDDIRASAVRVEAQDGDVSFSGTIVPGGDYAFYVHDGDATIAIPGTTSARVSVSTFDGEFQSEFTVRVDRFTSSREFDFTLGSGEARIRIEVFDGEIRLLRRR
jgi:DUF4097 and DUF4098 domain-containing protein YvlB